MTEMCRALFKYENERKISRDNLLTTFQFTQMISRVEKGYVLVCTLSKGLVCKYVQWADVLFYHQILPQHDGLFLILLLQNIPKPLQGSNFLQKKIFLFHKQKINSYLFYYVIVCIFLLDFSSSEYLDYYIGIFALITIFMGKKFMEWCKL